MISILFALTLFSFSSYYCSCYKFLSVANSFFHRRNYIFYHSTKSSLHLSTIFEEEANAIIEPAAKSFLDAIQYSLLNVPTYISPAPLSTSYLKIQSEGTQQCYDIMIQVAIDIIFNNYNWQRIILDLTFFNRKKWQQAFTACTFTRI